MLADSADPDQTALIHRLKWAFAVRIWPMTYFSFRGPTVIVKKRNIFFNRPFCCNLLGLRDFSRNILEQLV